MKVLRTGLVFAFGVLLGAMAFHPRTVSAQGGIHVKEASIGGYTVPMGSSIVGFSCVPSSEGDAKCYVASQ